MNKLYALPAAALLLATLAAPALADTAAPAQAPAADNLRVVVDPETGKLRAPTAAEIKASDDRASAARAARAAAQGAARSTATPAAEPLVKAYPNGARRARLTDAFHSHSVAVVRADGTLDTQCYETKDAATKALQGARTPQAATTQLDLE